MLPAMWVSHRNDFKPGLCVCRDCLFPGEYFTRSLPTCCFRAVLLPYISAFLRFPALRGRRCGLGGNISSRISITFVSGKGG